MSQALYWFYCYFWAIKELDCWLKSKELTGLQPASLLKLSTGLFCNAEPYGYCIREMREMGPCINKAENYNSVTSVWLPCCGELLFSAFITSLGHRSVKGLFRADSTALRISQFVRDKCHWNKIQGNLKGGEIQTQDDSGTLCNKATS